jgi:non-specific serine/threonine protein kinase/serine/threonine-protein kinase
LPAEKGVLEHWRCVEAIFHQVTAVPPEERSGRLEALCAGDSDLLEEASALLRASDEEERFTASCVASDAAEFRGPRPSISALLAGALAEPEDGRAAWLERACGQDPALLSEVRFLLASFQGSAPEPGALAAQAEASPESPQQLGPYRLVRQLGEGGMGAVFLATRADAEFEKKVAVKLIRPGADSEVLVARFLRERQILAGMEHPNIARLLDGGTISGQPYLVMDYVEGQRLDRYCDEGRLSIRQRLELFRKVCAPVHYAHQNLVVHRDLKPTNILVGADGEPKLLDFGIATLLEADNRGADLTAAHGLLLTPQYASPEQLRGRRTTVASDVYSLGVILYQLLCGCHPFQADTGSMADLVAAVVKNDPPLPSMTGSLAAAAPADTSPDAAAPEPANVAECRGETPDRLRRILRGDLDGIVLKALAKEPADRYGSVEEFSADIGRYLEGRPVQAVEGTPAYRADKFVRRHKLGVAAAAALALSLMGGLAGVLYEAHLARVERVHAELRFNEARQLAHYLLFDLYGSVQKLPGATPVQAEMAERSMQYLDRLAAAKSADAGLRVETAEGYLRLGDVLGDPFQPNLGKTPDALESYRKAIALLGPLLAANPADRRARAAYARANQGVGGILTFGGKSREGVAALEAAVRDFERLLAAAPGDVPTLIRAGDAYELLARQLSTQGGLVGTERQGDVRADIDKALARYGAARRLAPDDVGIVHKIALTYQVQGNITAVTDPGKAAGIYRRSLATLDQLPAAERESVETRKARASLLLNLGWVLGQTNDYKAAIATLEQARDIFDRRAELDREDKQALYSSTIAYRDLGIVYGYASNQPKAIENFRIAVAIFDRLLKVDPANETYRSVQADLQLRIGDALSETGHPEEAMASATAGLKTMCQLADEPGATASTLRAAARCLMTTEVVPLRNCSRALAYARKAAEMGNYKDSLALESLADAYWRNGDFAGARVALDRALALVPAARPGEKPSHARQSLEDLDAAIRAKANPD